MCESFIRKFCDYGAYVKPVLSEVEHCFFYVLRPFYMSGNALERWVNKTTNKTDGIPINAPKNFVGACEIYYCN